MVSLMRTCWLSGDSLTIYGEGKINLLSANPRAMGEMLIRLCAMDISDPSLQDPQWMTGISNYVG